MTDDKEQVLFSEGKEYDEYADSDHCVSISHVIVKKGSHFLDDTSIDIEEFSNGEVYVKLDYDGHSYIFYFFYEQLDEDEGGSDLVFSFIDAQRKNLNTDEMEVIKVVEEIEYSTPPEAIDDLPNLVHSEWGPMKFGRFRCIH